MPQCRRRPRESGIQSAHGPFRDHAVIDSDHPSFASRVIAWHRQHGRRDLPWQRTRDPYRIWLSEVMLQQTQVSAVIPYYARFLDAFPDVRALAAASIDEVFAVWSGLGYYRRAMHLHRAAMMVMRDFGGVFPCDVGAVAALPGVGRSTAAAVAAFAFGTRGAILDGNVKRVLARHHAIEGFPGVAAVERALWRVAESHLPDAEIEVYTQAMMDLGATVCVRRRPLCAVCPVAADCRARIEARVHVLPAPRPGKATPQRSLRMLMLEANGEVLFERRPPNGVWGGLLSLPEASLDDDVIEACHLLFNVEVLQMEPMNPIAHAFTHYRLTIHPLRIVVRAALTARAPGYFWLTPEQALKAALPAPIKRLMGALAVDRTALPLFA